MKNLKFKVKSKKTGEVYYPNELTVSVLLGRTTAHMLNGIEIEDPEFLSSTGRKDCNNQDIFEGDKLTLEYEGDQGHVIEHVTVRKVKDAYYLFNSAMKGTAYQAIKLWFVPHEMKLTLNKAA